MLHKEGGTTSRGSAPPPGNTPVTGKRCSVKGASHTAAPAVSPRHAADDGRRLVQTEQPESHTSSSAVGSSPLQAQHVGAGTDSAASLSPSKAGQEPDGEPGSPRQVSAKEQELWQQLQAANKDLQRAAQSQNALQQQVKAASAAASQYKQQAQEREHGFGSFKQQVSQLKVILQEGNLRASQDSYLSLPGASTSYDHLSVPQPQLSVNRAAAESHPAKWAMHANEIVG
ncbi:TPA: hypothetical protein ACH3X1_008149 [Trebouxia sp. C0004]